MREVGKRVRKKDAMALVTGQPVYTDDLAPKECLIVKVLRSPHANAIVEEVNKTVALKVPGVEAIYTWEDVPKERFAQAGQTYPEWSPYDRLILDQHVRFVGDPVAIVAGEDEACVDRALKMLKVKYKVLPAVLDYHTAKDNETLVHPEDSWKSLYPVGADNKRNLCAHMEEEKGDVEGTFKDCDIVLEHTYHVPAVNQTMMETFRTACYLDTYGRLVVLSSTQIVFHLRRILGNALGIPKSKIRVIKPRIGGGFGAKQTSVSEVYPAFVTWMTKKPSKMIYTRVESQIAGSPRHEMDVTVRLGADNDGKIRVIDIYNLSNTGAYGDHGPTTAGLTGHKSIPMYTGNLEAFRHTFDVVYTNQLAAGAYRGYGATQGIFALESMVNELAGILKRDPVELRMQNILKQGMKMPAYFDETAESCRLDECLVRAADMIGWKDKYPCRDMGNGKVRSVGIAMAMQGSCISFVDVGSATVMLNEDGSYKLSIAAADMGTAKQISDSLVSDKVDLVCAIATPSAQSAYNAAMKADIPVIYTAVTDPVAAELADKDGKPVGEVTGTSDKLPVEEQLKMIREMLPDAKKIGIMYTTSEANSVSAIEEYKSLVKKYDFELVEKGITTTADVSLAADDLLSKVDCITNLTDNTVVASLPTILDKANEKKIPVFGSEIEQVKIGCLAAEGIDYIALGKQTGKMAAKVLKGEAKASEQNFETITEPGFYVNNKVAENLGITVPDDLANNAVESFDEITAE